jgi:hypothetical protein
MLALPSLPRLAAHRLVSRAGGSRATYRALVARATRLGMAILATPLGTDLEQGTVRRPRPNRPRLPLAAACLPRATTHLTLCFAA